MRSAGSWIGFRPPERPETATASSAGPRAGGRTRPSRLDSQALAALGTACVDDGATAARLHANQKTMGTGTADLGRLVCAFHLEILKGSMGSAMHPEGLLYWQIPINRPEHSQGNRQLSQEFRGAARQKPRKFAQALSLRCFPCHVDKVLINYNFPHRHIITIHRS
mgnify:CR=1 FL=1